ncbi:MAG: OmpA family protein [Myxococcales bacterium]|nr:OmpA family protein [Myxococcales bacterium]
MGNIRITTFQLAFLALCSSFAAGCSGPEQQSVLDQGMCGTDADCGTGQVCLQDYCTQACLDQGLQSVEFEYASTDIRADQMADLEINLVCLRSWRESSVTLIGHTARIDCGTTEDPMSGPCTDDEADDLGRERAEALRDLFVSNGVDSSRIRIQSRGASEPLCRENDEECFGRNRRVIPTW